MQASKLPPYNARTVGVQHAHGGAQVEGAPACRFRSGLSGRLRGSTPSVRSCGRRPGSASRSVVIGV
eukprot:8763009-Alexandrium_andersonii.AAC.1